MGSSEETFLKLEAVNSTVGYNYCEVLVGAQQSPNSCCTSPECIH